MTSKILDTTSPWVADCLQLALSNNLLGEQDIDAIEQYARERLVPVSPWLILQYLASQASPDYVGMVSFQPMLRMSANKPALVLERIQSLHKAKLLTAQESETLHQWTLQQGDCGIVELLSMAASIAQYSEFMSHERVLLFLEELVDAGVVDAQTLLPWHSPSQKSQPFQHIDVLKACRLSVVLELPLQGAAPDVFLLELHQKTASVLPQLAFQDFSWEWVPNEQGHPDSICAQLCIGGQYYRMRSTATLDPTGKQLLDIDHHAYFHIFNKALVDQGAPYRLHHVSLPALPFQQPQTGLSAWGILALTSIQASVLHQVEPPFFTPYLSISDESFLPAIDTPAWKTAFEHFNAIGLFDYLDEETVLACGEQAFQGYLSNYVEFLACFPDMLLFYDGETGITTEPYRHLLTALEHISHHRFMPEDISDEYVPDSTIPFHLSFTLKGKYYSVNLLHSDTAYDPAFWQIVKRSNVERNPGAGFYNICTDGTSKAIIYLTDLQFAAMKAIPYMQIEPM